MPYLATRVRNLDFVNNSKRTWDLTLAPIGVRVRFCPQKVGGKLHKIFSKKS